MSGFNNEITNSGGPVSSSEPSMEEILASIRRILKDEEVGAEPGAEAEVAAAVAAEEDDEDILVLDSAMVVAHVPDFPPEFEEAPRWTPAAGAPPAEAPSANMWQEEARPAETSPDEAPPDERIGAEAEGESPEESPSHLTSELPDPDFPEMGDETVDLPLPEAEETPEPVMLTETGVADSVKETLMPDDIQQNVQPPHGLVSESASEAAASSIGSLIRSISSERSIAVGRPGLTLEDLVREELRPLLKSWLDSNLPPLVERIVRAEIQRVVERSTI
jgi:cell pole-organizing protein PopZ